MSTLQIVETLFETILVVSVIVALFKEDKLYSWEQKLKARWKR